MAIAMSLAALLAAAGPEFKSDKVGGTLTFKLPSDDYELKSYEKPQKGEKWGWTDTIAEIWSKDSAEDLMQGILFYSTAAWTNEKYANWRLEQWKTNNKNVKELDRKERESKYGKILLTKIRLDYQDNGWFYCHLFIQKGKHNLELMLWCPETVQEDSEKQMMKVVASVVYAETGAATDSKTTTDPKTTGGGEKPKVSMAPVKIAEDNCAGFGAGSTATYKVNSGGMEMEMMCVLLWHDEGKGYIVRTDMVIAGNKTEGQPMEFVVEKPKDSTGGDPNAEKPEITEGDEEIEVPAGKFKCHWTIVKTKQAVSKTWTNKEVLMGLVKSESEFSGAKSSMVLVKFEKK